MGSCVCVRAFVRLTAGVWVDVAEDPEAVVLPAWRDSEFLHRDTRLKKEKDR